MTKYRETIYWPALRRGHTLIIEYPAGWVGGGGGGQSVMVRYIGSGRDDVGLVLGQF